MSYHYNYTGPMTDSMESLFSGISFAAAGTALLIALAVYVIRSLALYRIANRRGIRHAWLAWIPVGCDWIVGSISDQYRYLVQGEIANRRKVLLWLGIANASSAGIVLIAVIAAVIKAIASGVSGSESAILAAILGPLMAILGVVALLGILSIVRMVFYYLSLSDLYRSCDPANATLYLVLSILGAILSGVVSYAAALEPILLLVCHSKEDGMPPRRTAPVYEAEPVWEET